MKLPIVEVADIISAAKFDWVDADNIYTTNVTPDEDDSGKTTFIRIQEASSELTNYANDFSSTLNASVEVQIFFSTIWSKKLAKNKNLTILDAKVAVLSLLQKSGWHIQRPLTPESLDPDTGQKTATFYINKIFRMESK